MTAPALAPAARRLTHLPALDGLRGWAVAVVVAYHLGFLPGGFLGVDVFFVLSGFLVTSLLLAEAEAGDGGEDGGGASLRVFWARRVRRLAPAVLLVVPTVLVGALAVGWPVTQRGALAWDGFATLTWWANWRQAGGQSYWASDPSPFRHAWSLSVEEQLYLLWPLVLVGAVALALRAGRSLRAVVGGAAVAGVVASTAWMVVSTQGPGADLSRAYVGTDTRLATPLVGCALACWWAPVRRGAPGRARRGAAVAGCVVLVALVATVAVDDPWLYQRGGFLLAAAGTAALVLGLAAPSGGGPRALRAVTTDPVSRYLGTRSYGIYLWSWPLQVLAAHRWPSLGRGALAALVVPASLAVAEASYRLVEDPIRRRRAWASRARWRRPAWAVGLAGAVAAVGLVAVRAEAPPVHERIDAAESARDAAFRPPPSTAPPPTESAGGAPAAPEDLRVMVTGDSVAFTAVFHAPHRDLPPGIASIDGRGIIGCGLLSGDGWAYPAEDGGGFTTERGESCHLQPESEATGLSGAPHVVLAMPGAWEHTAARSPEGEVVEARSDEMRAALVDALLARARAAGEAGAAYALVEWSCPGPEADPGRRDDEYIRWFGEVQREVVRRAVAEGLRASLVPATEEVCVGGDPTGDQAPAWAAATEGEVHTRSPEGGHWLWHGWLGPALVGWLHGT